VIGVKLPNKVSFIHFDISSCSDDDDDEGQVNTSFFGHYHSHFNPISSSDINRYQIEEAVITEKDGLIKLFNINTQR